MNATILHIEDNADNRLLVRRILCADGFTVLEASSASQAWKILDSHMPDLILMDINMPDVDGYTLTAQVKADGRFGAVPIIAMTANALRGDREKSMQAGCDGYIEKPIDIDLLARQIMRFLGTGRTGE